MFELKPLSKSGVPAALEKAEHYRLLNEAQEAESICLDILEVEPDNQHALVTLLLSLTDQFRRVQAAKVSQAREIVGRLKQEVDQAYYAGIICERQAKASLEHFEPGSGSVAYGKFREAMTFYERAAELASGDNNDATLRWNACARTMNRNPDVAPAQDNPMPDMLE